MIAGPNILTASFYCPFCEAELDAIFTDGGFWIIDCLLCGWYLYVEPDGTEESAVLRIFDINSPNLPLDELGAHLRRSFADLYNITWRRFEALVADVFKANGYRVILTRQARDGGADIIVLRSESAHQEAIIECKKYAKRRRVGIQVVRAVVGAAVSWDVRRAVIVTSSAFSRDARLSTTEFQRRGFALDLVDAAELLSLLGVYNKALPPLDKLTESVRREIIVSNRQA